MISLELDVSSGRYPTKTMAILVERVLEELNPEDDWSVSVQQKDDQTLVVRVMSVA